MTNETQDPRKLRTTPDLGDEFQVIVDDVKSAVRSQRLLERPRREAQLAALQVAEAFAAMEDARDLEVTMALLLGGVVPHLVPHYASSVRRVFDGLGVVLDAIDKAGVEGPGRRDVSPEAFREAMDALAAAMTTYGTIAALDQAAAGWRSFERDGNSIRLMYRLPEYMIRAVELNLTREAEHNAAFIDANAKSGDDLELHGRLEDIRVGKLKVDPRTDAQTLALAMAHANRAGDLLHRWRLPSNLEIENRGATLFTVSEYRAAAEAVHALATITMIVADGLGTVGAARLLQGSTKTWVTFICDHARISEGPARNILAHMTRNQSSRADSPTYTPFFEIDDDVLVMSTTCVIWQNPQTALRSVWASRYPTDFGEKVAALGHGLARDTSALFQSRGWAHVTEREIEGVGDIDTGTGEDGFFLVFEAKVFADEDNTRAEAREYWGQIADVVAALREPDVFRRVLPDTRLEPGEVRGSLLVTNRMNPALTVGRDFSLLGFDDLSDFVEQSTSPRDLWTRIKEAEAKVTLSRRIYTAVHGTLSFEVDGADTDAVPAFMRARPRG